VKNCHTNAVVRVVREFFLGWTGVNSVVNMLVSPAGVGLTSVGFWIYLAVLI